MLRLDIEFEERPSKKPRCIWKCCRCCEICSCSSVFIMTFLSLVFTGVTTTNYRYNIGATVSKATLNPIFAIFVLFSIVCHCFGWLVGVRKTRRPIWFTGNDHLTPHRIIVIVTLFFNLLFILIPIWGATSTTGAWLEKESIQNIFGKPSEASKANFARYTPYSFTDHLFWPFNKQYNSVLSSNPKYKTYTFKNITETPPFPNGDALPFASGSKDDTRLKYLEMDVYPSLLSSKISERSPVIVHIHGGAFILRDKSLTSMPIEAYQEQGYTIISIQYRLCPYGWNGWDIATDLVDALLWIQDNAEMLEIDPERVVLQGESAGGFASSYLCYLFSATNTTWTTNHENAPGVLGRGNQIKSMNGIKGCFNVYAAVDVQEYLSDRVQEWDMILTKVPGLVNIMLSKNYTYGNVNGWKTLLRENGPAFSVANLVTNSSPPTLSFHGANDIVVPPEQSMNLHKVLDEKNVTNAISILGLQGHTYDISEYSVGGQIGWFAMERFLAAVMPV